jgi:hypothetical protein
VNADLREDRLALAARAQVHLHGQIAAADELPRALVGARIWGLAWGPAHERAAGHLRATDDHARKARLGILAIQPPRLTSDVDAQDRVMHHAR